MHELTTLDVAHTATVVSKCSASIPSATYGIPGDGAGRRLVGELERARPRWREPELAAGRAERRRTARGVRRHHSRNVWHTWHDSRRRVGRDVGPVVHRWRDLAAIDAARNGDGRLEVFGIDPAGQVWHTWQTYAGGDWSGTWHLLHTDEGRLSSLRVGQNADGRLEVFGIDQKGQHLAHLAALNGGAWTDGWTPLYTDRDELAMLADGLNSDGRLEVFGIDPTGPSWHTASVRGWRLDRTMERSLRGRRRSRVVADRAERGRAPGGVWREPGRPRVAYLATSGGWTVERRLGRARHRSGSVRGTRPRA